MQQQRQQDSNKKERHIVTWTQEEDDILRDQITLQGTENWAIIASNFKDKTTRQCRRRWYTYLNSDFKKGGWSPEEDMLLCEAQRIFGNRWTEIAKVVSGRTDNAVKNRFSTLCKKRAKYEALVKENSNSFINVNNKRPLLQNEFDTEGTREQHPTSFKRHRRAQISDYSSGDRSHKVSATVITPQIRPPFAVLAQNLQNVNNIEMQHHISNVKEVSNDDQDIKSEGTFLKKNYPKISSLIQQAELLSSLATKISTENTEHSLEDAWKVVQDYLSSSSKEHDIIRYRISDIDIQLEDFKDLIEDLQSSNEGSHLFWRQPDLYEASPASSGYSSGSTLMPHIPGEKAEHSHNEMVAMEQDIEMKSVTTTEHNCIGKQEKMILSDANTNQVEAFLPFSEVAEQANNDGFVLVSSSTECRSPVHVTPMFRSIAAGIPSPNFSESERNFLLKTLGMESPSLNPSNSTTSQAPTCKRVLLHSLFFKLQSSWPEIFQQAFQELQSSWFRVLRNTLASQTHFKKVSRALSFSKSSFLPKRVLPKYSK